MLQPVFISHHLIGISQVTAIQTFFAFTWHHRCHLHITIFFFIVVVQETTNIRVLWLDGIIRICIAWWNFSFADFKMISVPEGQIKEILRPETFKEHQLITQVSQKWSNRPLYSCVLSYLALKWKWGWCWPCYDTDLPPFIMLMMFLSC